MAYKDKEAQREYQRLWRARRRAEWLSDKQCTICGSTEQLQIDHIDPGSKVSHKIWSWSEAKREAELLKCQVLCYPCHKEKTREHRRTREHGLTMYRVWGCRCSVCKATKATENAKRSQSKG